MIGFGYFITLEDHLIYKEEENGGQRWTLLSGLARPKGRREIKNWTICQQGVKEARNAGDMKGRNKKMNFTKKLSRGSMHLSTEIVLRLWCLSDNTWTRREWNRNSKNAC
jgi:hypothetical protein